MDDLTKNRSFRNRFVALGSVRHMRDVSYLHHLGIICDKLHHFKADTAGHYMNAHGLTQLYIPLTCVHEEFNGVIGNDDQLYIHNMFNMNTQQEEQIGVRVATRQLFDRHLQALADDILIDARETAAVRHRRIDITTITLARSDEHPYVIYIGPQDQPPASIVDAATALAGYAGLNAICRHHEGGATTVEIPRLARLIGRGARGDGGVQLTHTWSHGNRVPRHIDTRPAWLHNPQPTPPDQPRSPNATINMARPPVPIFAGK